MKNQLLVVILSLFFILPVSAEHLTCDPQPKIVVTKYQIDLNGKTFPVDIENVGENQVRIYYNIDHLDNGKHVVSAQAGNDKGEWSLPSNVLEFYRGVPTPQNIGLYCIDEKPIRVSQENWKMYYTSSCEPLNYGSLAFDGDMNTQWISTWTTTDPDTKHPHEIQIELGRQYTISGFYILPRQDRSWNGTIAKYKFYASPDGIEWVEIASGKLLKIKKEQFVKLAPVAAKYISLVALSEVNGGPWVAVAELNVLGY